MEKLNRRDFFAGSGFAAAGALAALGAAAGRAEAAPEQTGSSAGKKFKISLAGWSINSTFRKEWTCLDLPRIVREEFGLDGLEFVNSHFDLPLFGYLKDLKQRAADYGVELVLIMCDNEGDMSSEDKQERMQAAINHRKWVDIAHFLGCHAIRGNFGYTKAGTAEERIARCAESYRSLVEYADTAGMNVLIENHGGLSSYPETVVSLMKLVNHPRFGTLPDFGNFAPEVDKYQAIEALMPWAKAVSVKCVDFEPDGSHPAWDLDRMVEIVLAAGYRGFFGIEAGSRQGRHKENVLACKALLERHR
ncbi:MAG: sugar phosphate isomerase/epimerase [Candidatus Glassbacteria bacterium]|nr:sugar phosphate isomerase/epimerase [Candidatus Glassbacteria bacterium]